MRTQRGAALAIVLLLALIGSIAAYGALMLAMSGARHAEFSAERTQARYVAEAGLVIALHKLWNDPFYCGGPETVTVAGAPMSVEVTASDCAPDAPKVLSATVSY